MKSENSQRKGNRNEKSIWQNDWGQNNFLKAKAFNGLALNSFAFLQEKLQ